MIKFQFNINKSLESLLKTMKRTKETRYLLHLNSKHNSEVQELNRQQSLDISSWTLSNKRLDSLTINDCSIKNDADYRIDQNISSSITYSKRSGLSFKRRNKKALCKFVGYKHRRNSASWRLNHAVLPSTCVCDFILSQEYRYYLCFWRFCVKFQTCIRYN